MSEKVKYNLFLVRSYAVSGVFTRHHLVVKCGRWKILRQAKYTDHGPDSYRDCFFGTPAKAEQQASFNTMIRVIILMKHLPIP